MFYGYVEKRNSLLFGTWTTRQVAFDTARRHLYYTDTVPKHLQAQLDFSALVRCENSMDSMNTSGPAGTSREATSVMEPPEEGSTRPPSVIATPTSAQPPGAVPSHEVSIGVDPTLLAYRKKFKVISVRPVGLTAPAIDADPHTDENDLYQIEIEGEARPVASGETPAPAELLCPSAGWERTPEMYSYRNDANVRDPMYITELFEALRNQFAQFQMEKNRLKQLAEAEGKTLNPMALRYMTLSSPRTLASGRSAVKATRVVLRCRGEREYRRLLYVMESVLGVDRLLPRPYDGLPPFDPRNNITLCEVPMSVQHNFKELDKTVFYTFIRGDLLGTDESGELGIARRDIYLLLTHDMVYFALNSGNMPRWLRLFDVFRFEYNYQCHIPYVAFICSDPAPDVMFVPRGPAWGRDAKACWDPRFDVRRLYMVLRTNCFSSLSVQRVIKFKEVPDPSPRAYVMRKAADGHPLSLEPGPHYAGFMHCPLPKVQLAQVWNATREQLTARMQRENMTAIPIYENSAGNLHLNATQLRLLQRRLERERENEYDIVGMSMAQLMRLRDAIAGGHANGANPSQQRAQLAGERRTRESTNRRARSAPPRQAENAATASHQSGSPRDDHEHAASVRREEESDTPDAALMAPTVLFEQNEGQTTIMACSLASVVSAYAVPGTRYYTSDDIAAMSEAGDVIVEHHRVLPSEHTPSVACSPSQQPPPSAPVAASVEGAVPVAAAATTTPTTARATAAYPLTTTAAPTPTRFNGPWTPVTNFSFGAEANIMEMAARSLTATGPWNRPSSGGDSLET